MCLIKRNQDYNDAKAVAQSDVGHLYYHSRSVAALDGIANMQKEVWDCKASNDLARYGMQAIWLYTAVCAAKWTAIFTAVLTALSTAK